MESSISPRLHKLIWSEGMYLAPHHFQSQSRFFEASAHFLTECFWQFSYGFLGLEIDENELQHGSFQLHHLRGIMPDGLAFDLSKPDDLPPCLPVAGLFPDTGHPLMLSLAVASYREGHANVAWEGQANGHLPRRFKPSAATLTDFNTGQDLKSIDLLRPNFRIVTDTEIGATDVVLSLARILRDGKGQYVLDPLYVPPCLNVAASPGLRTLLDRLLAILVDKSRGLSQRRRKGPDLRGDPRELVEFWLLHTINSAIPLLRQWKAGRSPHPMQIYLGLSSLAGALCTFFADSDPMDLPAYNHSALGDCFGTLDEHIRRRVELGLPTNCLSIPLRKLQPLLFGAEVRDSRCFGPSRWVLAIKADAPETTLISQTPSRVKVFSRDLIERVVRQAVPGVPLTYLPVPPSSVPPGFGVVYFSIDREHPLFDSLRKHSNIGVYVPGEIPNVELVLHVVIGETNR
jgi:type VI secretion system protein ImpJ